MVLKARKHFGTLFRTDIGVTQGDPFSLMIFNIALEAVVMAVLVEVCGPQEAHHGFGWVVGHHNIVFYKNDGQIDVRNPIWVQKNLISMVRTFDRVGIQKNMGKTKAMVCTPGFILGQQGSVK